MFTIWFAIPARGISARHIDVCGIDEARAIWDAMSAAGMRLVSARP